MTSDIMAGNIMTGDRMAGPLIAATVEGVQDVHNDIRIIRIRPDHPALAWQAGQYMELAFDNLPPRPYSIANAPHHDVLEFHIRSTGSGGASDHAVRHLKHGDTLMLRGPFGNAAALDGNTMPVLLIAGGVGLPSLKAILDDAMHKKLQTPITLYWGVRVKGDLYMADYFTKLQDTNPRFTFIPVIGDQDGKTVADAIAEGDGDLSATQIYLAGPAAMITATLPLLLKRGAKPDHIHGDDHALRHQNRILKGPK